MNVLQLAQALAKEMGLKVMASAVGNDEREAVEAVHFLTESCKEAARRVDWGAMIFAVKKIGTGSNQAFILPSDYARMMRGAAVYYGTTALRGGVTADEMKSMPEVAGTPRFYWVWGNAIQFWPYLANGEQVTVNYVSTNWNSTAGSDAWETDGDESFIPDDVILRGAVYRWRRQKNMDYADNQAEYEGVIAQWAFFNAAARSP